MDTNTIQRDELAHFGILGMKLGVRREPGKGERKLTKLSEKHAKLEDKAASAKRVVIKAQAKISPEKLGKAKMQLGRLEYKALKKPSSKTEKKLVKLKQKVAKMEGKAGKGSEKLAKLNYSLQKNELKAARLMNKYGLTKINNIPSENSSFGKEAMTAYLSIYGRDKVKG